MARIDSKVIFVTTSPRTPAKMIPEIGLLHTHFAGQQWNSETQRAFMELLREKNFFNGKGANGGNIKANLKFDDFGNPMSTAQGNMADIVCDYGDFGLTVELTMQSGLRQYETEGEPVSRHLAKFKRETEKPAYCLFIAPNINDACKAHFYALHKMNIQYYGGVSTIVPLPLSIFIKMVEVSYNANYVPEPRHVQRFFKRSNELANSTDSEVEWYNGIILEALNWLKE